MLRYVSYIRDAAGTREWSLEVGDFENAVQVILTFSGPPIDLEQPLASADLSGAKVGRVQQAVLREDALGYSAAKEYHPGYGNEEVVRRASDVIPHGFIALLEWTRAEATELQKYKKHKNSGGTN